MSDYKPKVGDRVRVVLEGEVESVDSGGSFDLKHNWINPDGNDTLVSVEKVEPPVEVFGPGALLRRKSDGTHYLVTSRGWTIVGLGYVETSNKPSEPFTSEHYEKVNLG